MIKQGLMGAGIDAFAAFGAGDTGFTRSNTFFADGECWTNLHAFHALPTFFPVNAYLKGIRFVCEGLKRAERAE